MLDQMEKTKMEEELYEPRSEEEIRKEVFGKQLSDIHLGNYDHSITRPTVSSARKSVVWSSDRKIYETASRRRLDEFKSNPYFKFQYPEIPRHWPGTWAVMNQRELSASASRLSSRPGTAVRPRTAPVHSLFRDQCKNRPETARTVKTTVFLVT